MFGVSGAALSKIRHMQNGGKRPRHSVDQWDRQSTFSPSHVIRTNFVLVQRKRKREESGKLTAPGAVMDRDRRLTGFLRGQTDQVAAPAGFELSNGWRVSIAHPFVAQRGVLLEDRTCADRWKQVEKRIM